MNNDQKNQENVDLFEFYDQQPSELLKERTRVIFEEY